MWLSKQIIRQENQPQLQGGKVTLNDNGTLEAVSSGVERSVRQYSPFGYCYSLPIGESMLMTRLGGETASVGVEMKPDGLATGEIKLTAKSGAYIYLRNDGRIELNGLVINRKGEIEND